MTIYIRAADGQFLCIDNSSGIHFEPAYNMLTIDVDSESIEDLVRMFQQEVNLKVEKLNLFES